MLTWRRLPAVIFLKARCSSYDDEIDYVVNSNTSLLLAGFGLLFVYVAVVLGNVNILEQRVTAIKHRNIFFGLNLRYKCEVICFSNQKADRKF